MSNSATESQQQQQQSSRDTFEQQQQQQIPSSPNEQQQQQLSQEDVSKIIQQQQQLEDILNETDSDEDDDEEEGNDDEDDYDDESDSSNDDEEEDDGSNSSENEYDDDNNEGDDEPEEVDLNSTKMMKRALQQQQQQQHTQASSPQPRRKFTRRTSQSLKSLSSTLPSSSSYAAAAATKKAATSLKNLPSSSPNSNGTSDDDTTSDGANISVSFRTPTGTSFNPAQRRNMLNNSPTGSSSSDSNMLPGGNLSLAGLSRLNRPRATPTPAPSFTESDLSSSDYRNEQQKLSKSPPPSMAAVANAAAAKRKAAAAQNLERFDDTHIFKEGYLLKEGYRIKSWKNRWFVVKKNRVQYFSKKFGAMKGEIITSGATIRECPERKLEHCFKIETTTANNRVWYIQVPKIKNMTYDQARELMFEWFDAITTYGGATEALPDVISAPDKKKQNKNNNNNNNNDSDGSSSFNSSMSDDSEYEKATHEERDRGQKKKNVELGVSQRQAYEDEFYYGKDNDSDAEAADMGATFDANSSDEELWDILQNSRQTVKIAPTVQERRTNEKKAVARLQRQREEKQRELEKKKMEEEEERKRQESAKADNLFAFFSQTSEKQQMTREEVFILPQVNVDGELQQARTPKTPFGDISILEGPSTTKMAKLDAEKLKHQMRKEKFIKSFSDDVDTLVGGGSGGNNNHGSGGVSGTDDVEETYDQNESFRDLIDDEDIEDDEASLLSSRSDSGLVDRGSFRKHLNNYGRSNPSSICGIFAHNYGSNRCLGRTMVFVSGVIFLSLISVLLFFRADIAFSKKVFKMEETEAVAEINQVLDPVKFLFGQPVAIVTLMETALSESGAFIYRAIYENSVFKQSSILSPVFETRAYVGKVFQLGAYTSIILGLLATAVGSGLVTGLPRSTWIHGFMRTPFFIIEYLSINIESSLLGVMQWWQWLLVNMLSCATYFAIFFALKASHVSSLLSSSISYECFAFINFAFYAAALLFTPKYRTKYEAGNLTQDRYTISRYLKHSSYVIVWNIVPCAIQIMCGIIVRSKLKAQYAIYSEFMAITGLFTYMGIKVNQSLILSLGTRLAKQLMYRNYTQFLLKCMLMFVAHSGLLVGLFFALDIEQMPYIWGVTWGMILSTILLNMFQCFAINFEQYALVSCISVVSHTFITFPSTLVSLLRFESIRGIFFAFIIANCVQIIILGAVLLLNMIELKSIWLEISVRRRVGYQEDASLTNNEL